MATVVAKFRTRQATKSVTRALGKANAVVSKEIQVAMRRLLSKQGPPRSKPGQVPRREFGILKRSVKVTGNAKGIEVRSVNYGLFLETGTENMEPRPWASRILFKQRKRWEKKIAAAARKFTGGRRVRKRSR